MFNIDRDEIVALITDLIPTIDDDYRASDDPDDDQPGMQITISTADGCTWNYQTGDNSYSDACYGDPCWAVSAIYLNSDPGEVADDLLDQLADVWNDYSS